MDTLPLRRALVREILLLKDSLERHPRAGFVCPLPNDVFLEQKSGKAFRLIQGEWLDFPLQDIPLEHLLDALRSALERRHQLTETRISRLVQNLDTIEAALKSCSLAKLNALAQILEEFEENRRRD